MKTNKMKLIALVCCMALLCGVMAACGAAAPAAAPAEAPAAAPAEAPAAEAPAAPEKPIELTVSLEGGEAVATAARWNMWADKVTEATNGRVTFQFYYDSTLLDGSAQMQQLKAGIADIGEAHKYAADGFVMNEKWYGMTGGCPVEGMIKIGRDLVAAIPELAAELEGIKTLAYAYGGAKYQIMTVSKPVYTVEDMKGLVIWCEADFNDFVKEMGATPVNSPWPEVYSSLQKNMYDGLILAPETLKMANLADVIDYVTMIDMALPAGPGIFMNLDSYNSLPDDIKAVIDDPALAQAVEDMLFEQADALEKEGLEFGKETQGVEVIEISADEQQKFIDCLNRGKAAIVEDLNAKGLPGDEFLAKFVELCEQYK